MLRSETSPLSCKGTTKALFYKAGIMPVKKAWLKICATCGQIKGALRLRRFGS